MQCRCQFKKRGWHSALFRIAFLAWWFGKNQRRGSGHRLRQIMYEGKKALKQWWSNIVTSHPENVIPLLLEILRFDWMSWPNISLALSRVGARCHPKVPSTINSSMILRNVAGLLQYSYESWWWTHEGTSYFLWSQKPVLVHKRFLIHAEFHGQSFP